MKKKLFIALYTTGIVLAVVALSVIVNTIEKTPAVPPTQEEIADTSIAQYGERPNSTTTIGSSGTSPFFSFLFPRREPRDEGCSLRFSFAPRNKAVISGGAIEYDVALLNKGNEACENVSLSAYYMNDEHFVSSNPVPTASDYYWSVGNLEPGKEFTIALTTMTTIRNGQNLFSEACVTADNSPDVCSGSVIFVEQGAANQTELTTAIKVERAVGAMWGSIFTKKEFGIWVWNSTHDMTPAYAKEVVEVAKKNGFNVIYITIDDYLSILEIKDVDARRLEKEKYMKELSIFIQASQAVGIEVDAVGGAKDWAIPSNRWKGYALIDFVKEYNQTFPKTTLRGLQYDVEPYLLDEYDYNKKKILKEYVEFIDESVRQMESTPAQFSIVIPHFYDSEQKWTPAFEYAGTDAHTFTHLLQILSRKEKTSIIIMAYRNFFEDENGTKEISEVEVKEASNGGSTSKIIIAQETGNVPPGYVTFYDYPKISLFDALSEIKNYFGGYRNFGGMAVHYFDSFVKMD